jgi:ParB family transcriptional regulator, chromosome partitioning protein
MAIDFSLLEEDKPKKPIKGNGKDEAATASGRPLELPIKDIEEDPNQPRREYSQGSLAEMADSIKERGVIQPISVKSHPDKPGKWIINFGSRRYRSSVIAKKKTIPAFVDENSNSYGQVIENDQREALTPMEMAIFIQQRIEEGEKQVDIAHKLSRSRPIISAYLALIDPPNCVADAYRTGKCTSPRTLYEVRQLHKQFPKEVDGWCAKQEEITRKGVGHLKDDLSGQEKEVRKGKKVSHDKQTASGGGKTLKEPGQGGEPSGSAEPKKDNAASTQKSDALESPILVVEFEGRKASVLLNRKPSQDGMIGISFVEGGDVEVEAKLCQILHLTEA